MIAVPLVFILAVLSEHSIQRERQVVRARERDQEQVAAKPLDLNRRETLFRGPELFNTVQACVQEIDRQLRDWAPTGRPKDVDRRSELLAERKSLTGE